MAKSLIFLAFSVALIQAIFAQGNGLETTENFSAEKLSVAVRIIEDEEGENGPRKTEVYVNLNVTIEEDMVKVNGKLTELDVLTEYEIDAEIVYSADDIRISPVTVHVMVIRNEMKNGGGHYFLIEEQVQIIEDKKVEQLNVTVLSIHMDVNGKEYKRSYEIISFEESRIKKSDVTRHCGHDDSAPREWSEPELPDESGLGDRHGYRRFGHGHGRRHRHHRRKSLCSRFRKLPLAARIAILVGIVCVVLAGFMTCAMCCCRKKKAANYEISKKDDFKTEFDMDEDQAEPLPEKLAFDDKEVLIA